MSNALSGLTVASRAAEVVSSNVSNALTEGYARREVVVTARMLGTTGQGAQVSGIRRASDPLIISDRRAAEAAAAGRGVRADFLAGIEATLGSPETAGSLSARIAALDTAMIQAASRPDSDARLTAVADAARALATTLGEASGAVQKARQDAEISIATQVKRLNDTLANVASVNAAILSVTTAGRDASALMDQRQQLIDSIATIVPLREVDRGYGQVALYTTGGAALLDGVTPAQVGFQTAGFIVADMTLASGALAGLTLNGRPVNDAALAGGSLAAQFALRDGLAPAMQADLDALARDLVERFQPGPDTTLAPGAAGLFTDDGLAFDAAQETGLAGRLRLNAAADPAQGGAVFRLRDGLGAATPGDPGDARLLTALHEGLSAPRAAQSGRYGTSARSLSDHAAQILSSVAQGRLSAQAEQTFTAARAEALKLTELEGGVDTDRELQDLLVIERLYGANARVMQVVDKMLGLLLER